MHQAQAKINISFWKASLVFFAVFLFLFSVIPDSSALAQSSASDCSSENIYNNITGSIVSTGSPSTGTLTNNSDCTYTVSIASYKMFNQGDDLWIETQTLYDYVTVEIGPYETIGTDVLRVDVPNCYYQIDLIEGSPITPPHYGGLGHALFAADYGDHLPLCSNQLPSCNETATAVLTGPANVNPGQSVSFSANIKNTGNTRWYHGSYFQFVQTSGYTIAPTYGHYTPAMYPQDERAFSFTFTAPTTPGTYSITMQNVHKTGAEYQLENGDPCATATPTSDVYFGQTGTYTFTVAAPINTPPVITLIGLNPATVTVGQAYVDPGATAADLEDGNITANIIRTGTLNTNVVGTYTFTYNVSDSQGLAATPVTRTIDVIPLTNHPPIGYVDGVSCSHIGGWAYDSDSPSSHISIEVYKDGPYGTGTLSITTTANEFRSDVGGYAFGIDTPANLKDGYAHNVYIYALDVQTGSRTLLRPSANPSLQYLTITCNTPPVLTLVGANPIQITLGGSYTEFGATAMDNEAGNITSAIVISGSVNTLVVGTYNIYYNVSDPQGLAAAQISRTVNVVQPGNNLPQGYVDGASCSHIGGWSVDFDSPDAFVTIEIYRGGPIGVGSLATTTIANQFRQDINDLYGENHAFGINTPSVFKDGYAHTMYIYAIDLQTSSRTLLLPTPQSGLSNPISITCNTAPVITLAGANPMTIIRGSAFTEPGYTAMDNEAGNITSAVVVGGTVNTAVVGQYILTYNVSDPQGLAATQVSRTVNVLDVPPVNTPPVITLIGANPATFYVGDPYVELGATAQDAQDGNITSSLVINSSNVNTSVVGTYTVTYNVTDSGGLHAIQVSRTVNVLQVAQTGSIRVCLILADDNNVIATSSSHLPAGAFSISIATSTGFSGTTIQSKTWTTASFDPNTRFILSGEDDADCVTYNSIPYGTYYYSQLSVTGAQWLTPKYNDNQSIHPINNVFDFALYSGELFNSDPNDDASRNFISDGQIVIDGSNQNKTLVIYEIDDPGLVCLAPQITSPLTASVQVGQPFTYTVTASSTSPVSFSVTNLPGGLTFSTTTNTISGTPTTAGVFNINLFAVNNCVGGIDTEVLALTVTPVIVGSSANLSVTKVVSSATPSVGDQITYTITINNAGPSTANNVLLTDILSGRLSFVSASTTVGTYSNSTGVWSVGSLQNGASATLTIVATIGGGTHGQQIANTASVTANENDPNTGNNTATVNVVVNGTPSCSANCGGGGGGGGGSNSANLGVTKTVNKTNALPGETVIYTINVVNYGPNSTTDVVVNDVLPSTLNFVSASATTGAYNNLTGVWNIGSMANGASAGLTITTTVKAGTIPQTITNNASVTGSVNDQDNSNNNSSVSFNSGNIVVPPTPTPGSCYYLLDYLRADFNNNPVEVIKLQVFLKELEGFRNLQITGVYDAQTIVALDAFQNRYASDILTPWGHTAPTSYTYILTKKKVNEIYCRTAFPVTPLQQNEIDNYRNFLLGLQNTGVVIPGNNNSNNNNNVTPVINEVGTATTTPIFTVIATSTTPDVGTRFANNIAFAFGALGDWIGSVCGFLNLLLLLAILIISYLWYRDNKHNKEIEDLNKKIDLEK